MNLKGISQCKERSPKVIVFEYGQCQGKKVKEKINGQFSEGLGELHLLCQTTNYVLLFATVNYILNYYFTS